jgi:hypothetical protein
MRTDGLDGGLRGRVMVWEWLGEEGQADVDCDGQIVQVVTHRDLVLHRGDEVWLHYAAESLLLFDPDSQKRIDVTL